MAGTTAVIEDDRSGAVFRQPAVDLPDQSLALCLVGLDRLLLVHLLELGVAVVGVIALRTAGIMLVEIGVGIIDSRPRQIGADHEVLAGDLGKPIYGFDSIQF